MKPHVARSLVEHALVHGRGGAQLLGNIVSAFTGKVAVPDPLPHPKGAVTLALRGYSQLDPYSCGAVAGWCIVDSLHPGRRSFDKFYARCLVTKKLGVTMANLKAALKASDVGVGYVRALPFERLRSHIDEGSPILCNVRRERDEDDGHEPRHWLVVYGYHPKSHEVYVAGNGWAHLAGGLSLEGQHVLPWKDFAWMFNTSGGGLGHAFVCWRPDEVGAGEGLRRTR